MAIECQQCPCPDSRSHIHSSRSWRSDVALKSTNLIRDTRFPITKVNPFEIGALQHTVVTKMNFTYEYTVTEGRFEGSLRISLAYISAGRRAATSAPSAGTTITRSLMRIKQNSHKKVQANFYLVHSFHTNFLSAEKCSKYS